MGTNLTWGKVAQIIVPILLTALLGVLGFLVKQNMDFKSEMGNMKEAMATNHGELKGELGRQGVTVKNLSRKIDAITVIKIKVNNE